MRGKDFLLASLYDIISVRDIVISVTYISPRPPPEMAGKTEGRRLNMPLGAVLSVDAQCVCASNATLTFLVGSTMGEPLLALVVCWNPLFLILTQIDFSSYNITSPILFIFWTGRSRTVRTACLRVV
jgi:hypothetical protein